MTYERGKYITGEINGVGCAVCFPETVPHDSLRCAFEEVWHAGFFTVNPGDDLMNRLSVVCYGESVGLGVRSDSVVDVRLVARALGLSSD